MRQKANPKYPDSIAVIMDGNGRWAKKRGLPRTAGHKAGFDAFVKIVDACDELGIGSLTVYAFSTENWNRSEDEVGGIIKLLNAMIPAYMPQLIEHNIRLRLFGNIEMFDKTTRKALDAAVDRLKDNTGMNLGVCLSYGGRAEIVRAFNLLAAEGKTVVTEDDISSKMFTNEIPDPDLVIRTSGEMRISNFLLWQSAYAEYYFSECLWPDFDREQLVKAFDAFATRERRYGK